MMIRLMSSTGLQIHSIQKDSTLNLVFRLDNILIVILQFADLHILIFHLVVDLFCFVLW
jgi:hypothetical protein